MFQLQPDDVRWALPQFPTAHAVVDFEHTPEFKRLVNAGVLRFRSGYETGYYAVGRLFDLLLARELSQVVGTALVVCRGGRYRG